MQHPFYESYSTLLLCVSMSSQSPPSRMTKFSACDLRISSLQNGEMDWMGVRPASWLQGRQQRQQHNGLAIGKVKRTLTGINGQQIHLRARYGHPAQWSHGRPPGQRHNVNMKWYSPYAALQFATLANIQKKHERGTEWITAFLLLWICVSSHRFPSWSAWKRPQGVRVSFREFKKKCIPLFVRQSRCVNVT